MWDAEVCVDSWFAGRGGADLLELGAALARLPTLCGRGRAALLLAQTQLRPADATGLCALVALLGRPLDDARPLFAAAEARCWGR
jgi:hypothetical protein